MESTQACEETGSLSVNLSRFWPFSPQNRATRSRFQTPGAQTSKRLLPPDLGNHGLPKQRHKLSSKSSKKKRITTKMFCFGQRNPPSHSKLNIPVDFK
jgi:hypothetical protein